MGDFDFLVGTWDIDNRVLVERLAGRDEWRAFRSTSRCWQLFGGAANLDEFTFPDGTQGLTMRVFDPVTRSWSLHWANSTRGALDPPLVGRFADGEGRFHGDEDFQGKTVRARYIWSRITPTSCRWEQAWSTDGEQSWETNWIMDFTRVSDRPADEPRPIAS